MPFYTFYNPSTYARIPNFIEIEDNFCGQISVPVILGSIIIVELHKRNRHGGLQLNLLIAVGPLCTLQCRACMNCAVIVGRSRHFRRRPRQAADRDQWLNPSHPFSSDAAAFYAVQYTGEQEPPPSFLHEQSNGQEQATKHCDELLRAVEVCSYHMKKER